MSENSIVDEDLGQATIVYDHPERGTVEEQFENEHVAYFQDHWIIKSGEDDDGNDLVRRIPYTRVHYVERSVERFEDEVATLRDQVQSFADDLRSRIFGGDDGKDDRGRLAGSQSDDEPGVHRIDVEGGESDGGGDGNEGEGTST